MQQNKAILPLSDILAENTIKIGGLNGDLAHFEVIYASKDRL